VDLRSLCLLIHIALEKVDFLPSDVNHLDRPSLILDGVVDQGDEGGPFAHPLIAAGLFNLNSVINIPFPKLMKP